MYIDIQNGANTATNTQYRVCLNAAKADVATKLATSNVGSTGIPVYFSNGIPVSCGNTLNVNITGNAATATKATQDGNGNVITSKYVTLDTAQTISGTKTMTGSLKVSGRYAGSGDDEGIIVGFANNGYAGLCLGGPSEARSVFYFKSDGTNPFWRYNNGSASYDISHPSKSGTIALTSDLANYLPLSGGTMTGAIITPGDDSVVIRPAKNNYDQIGSSSYKFWQIYATTFYGTLSGNASTATKLQTARTIRTNLSSTTAPSFDGTANITPGVTGTLGIGNGGTGSTTKKGAWSNLIPYYDAPWSTIAEDTGNNWASLGNSSVTWWPDNANGIYNKPSSWGLAFTISAGPSGSQEMHQLWFSQANGSIYHRGGNGATASSMEANSWAKLWQTGDSVTGAVWNDYAEYRESDCGEFGYVLTEKGDDTLTKTAERLQPFAGVSSDTWGFSQGETDKAKTPIAVAGRVLVYTYQDRNNYKPGDCVCAAPGGTVDIMTREEVKEWPDRIVGTVSCVPDYEEWGGGEGADRPSVRVDGRIWIKVR